MEEQPKQNPLPNVLFRIWLLVCVALLLCLVGLIVHLTSRPSRGRWYVRERAVTILDRPGMADESIARFQTGVASMAEIEAALGAPDLRRKDGQVSVLVWRCGQSTERRTWYLGLIPGSRSTDKFKTLLQREFSFVGDLLAARDGEESGDPRIGRALRQARLRSTVEPGLFRAADGSKIPAKPLLQAFVRGGDPAVLESAIGPPSRIWSSGSLEVHEYALWEVPNSMRPEYLWRRGSLFLYIRSGTLAMAPLEPPDPADASLDEFNDWYRWTSVSK